MNRYKARNWTSFIRAFLHASFAILAIALWQTSAWAQNQGATLTTTTPNAWFAYYYDANNVLKYIEVLEGINDRSIKPYFGQVPELPPANMSPEDSTSKKVRVVGGNNAAFAVYYGITCFTGKLIKLAVEDLVGVSREISTLKDRPTPGPGDCKCACVQQGGTCWCPPPCR
jgi:hypothetical protein